MKPTSDKHLIRKEAKRLYEKGSDDDVEVDEDAKVYISDNWPGAYVQAWVWVPFEIETLRTSEEETKP